MIIPTHSFDFIFVQIILTLSNQILMINEKLKNIEPSRNSFEELKELVKLHQKLLR